MELKYHSFLLSLGAHRVKHSGRTLFDHLKGVHDLLRDWDNPEHVCLGGLFHSIYGTRAFGHITVEKSSRPEVSSIIGAKAENLAYLFSEAKDRPLFESISDPEIRLQLMEIEAANLIEQGGNSTNIRKLSRIKLSNGARAALNSGP